MKTTKNYGLKKPESSDFYNVDDFNGNVDTIDAKLKELETPIYTEATTLTALTSGEKLSVSFGKIAKAVKDFISHITAKATTSVLGHVKLSDSSAVTDPTGLALPATEKNASIAGTLAHQISEVNSDLKNIKVKASSSLKQVIVGRASNTSESYNELRFEISDAEHYLFRIHDNTDQLIVWHYVNGAYTKVWNWTNLNSQINTHSNTIKDITNYIGKTGDVPNGAWIDGSTKSLESIVNNMKGATLVIYYRPNDTDRQYGLDNSNWGVCACTTLGDNSYIEWTSLDGGKRYYKFKCTGTWDANWYPTTAFNTPAVNGIIEDVKLVSYKDGCKNNQTFLYTKSRTANLPKGAEFGFRKVYTFKDAIDSGTENPNAMIVLYDMNGSIYMNTIQTGSWLGWRQFSSVAVEDAN